MSWGQNALHAPGEEKIHEFTFKIHVVQNEPIRYQAIRIEA